MRTSLFSAQWHRVADRRPLLRPQIELKRQWQRGVAWTVLVDPAGGEGEQVHRINQAGHALVGRCDGRRTVNEIWEELLDATPDEAPTQDEVLHLLVELHQRGLLQFDVAPDVESLFRAQDAKRRRRLYQGVNPWAFRLVMGNPTAWLMPLERFTPALFSPVALALWVALMIIGGATAMACASELAAHARMVMQTPGYLLLAWLIYPPIKLVHETAHALAARHGGASVTRAGISLLLLTPVPFVDASQADGFRNHLHRAMVSAAGVMAELMLAGIALAVWLAVQPGWVRDAALVVMTVGAVSTVLVNGNPLLRFDGYYLMCDLLDLRNLASRSSRLWREQLGRRLLGVVPPSPIEAMPGERPWLWAYAPLSAIYRLVMAVVICLWLGSLHAWLGIAALVVCAGGLIGRPLWQAWRVTQEAAEQEVERSGSGWRVHTRAALAVAAVALLLGLMPWPDRTVAEGVVWLPEKAQIRAGTDGFIARLTVAHGQRVKTGDVLVELHNELLNVERAGLVTQAQEIEVDLFKAMLSDPQAAPGLRDQLAAAHARIERIDQKIAQLRVCARADGVVVMPRQADMPGSYAKQGELLGHLITADPLTVRVALPQEDVDLVRAAMPQVGVRLAEYGQALFHGRLTLDTPAAVARLPSAALGDRGGGRILTDPTDSEGVKPRSAVVVLDVEVADATSDRIGARALVRFEHGAMPLAGQALRRLRQLLLRQFAPAG